MAIYLSRRLPNSNLTRQAALTNAKEKQDSGPADDPLTTATKGRLDSIEPAYKAAMQQGNIKKAELAVLTAEKKSKEGPAYTAVSRFIQTFNNGVALGLFPAAHRAYYGLDVNSDALPYLGSEQALKSVGLALIQGDADRTAAGGAPMAIPDIALLTARFNDWKDLLDDHSNASDARDAAQEAVAALNEEANGVIRKVWDEVEAFYNEEDKESQRANAREWGVVYISVGQTPSELTVILKDANTQDALAGEVYLDGPDQTIEVDASGTATEEVNFIGLTNATAEAAGYSDQTQILEMEEGGNYTLTFLLTPLPPP